MTEGKGAAPQTAPRPQNTNTDKDAGRSQSSSGDGAGEDIHAGLAFIEHLNELRVPLFTAEPGGSRDVVPDLDNAGELIEVILRQPNDPEFVRPKGWPNLTAEGNQARIGEFRCYKALCAICGIPVAVFDSDTKNGGDPEKVRALLADLKVRIYAEIDTPSGGKHLYIKGHPDLPTVHSKADNPKLPEYQGLDIQSHRANVFLPGTLRPKYADGGYTVVFDELDQLDPDDDDQGTTALVDWVAEQWARRVRTKARTTPGGAKEWEWEPCEPWNGDPPDARQRKYLGAALAGEADKVAKTEEGGRNDALFTAALKLGSYIAGAGLDEQKVRDALEGAAVANGYTEEHGVNSTRASIGSGLRAGRKNPRAVPPPSAPGPSASVDVESFWELTGTLRHVRDFAHAQLVGPWAVLGVALARVVATIPPTVQLPPWVGGNASLNLFVALVGPSGDGKGGTEKAAKAAFRLGPVYTTGVGSGQGINHLFAHYDGKRKATVTDRWSVYFSVPEVDIIASERGRTGSNLLPQLRKAWDGADLTFGYADRTRSIVVDDHTYRLAMVVGVQPRRAGTLLGDVDAGTPQRYLWLPANAPNTPMEDVEPPEPIDLGHITEGWPPLPTDLEARLLAGAQGGAEQVLLVVFPDAAREEIRTNRKRKNRGESTDPALDGHLGLCRMKAAAALALLHGEREVTPAFWDMSGVLMQMSQTTRASVEAQLAAKDTSRNRARGRAEGERSVVAEEVREEAAIKRVARNVTRWVTVNGEHTRDQVRKGCVASRDRDYFDPAIERLVQAGSVEVVENMIKLVAKC